MTAATAVDVHAHMVPPGLTDRVAGGAAVGIRLDGASRTVLAASEDRLGPIAPTLGDLSARVAWMDERSVGCQWVSPWIDLFTWHTHAERRDRRRWVRLINDALLEACEAHPDRLLPVPFVDPASGIDEAVADLRSIAAAAESPAVLLNTTPGGDVTGLGDPRLDPFWQALADVRIPALLHPPVNGPSCGFTSRLLQNVAGRVSDVTMAAVDLVLSGVPRRFPGLQMIIVHGGGFLPYQAHRLDGLQRAGLFPSSADVEKPSDALRDFWYDTVALDASSLRLLVERVGWDRVLLGTDAPFPIGDPDPVGTIRAADLSSHVESAICRENAMGLRSGRMALTKGGL